MLSWTPVIIKLEFDEVLDSYHIAFETRRRNAWDIVKGLIDVIKAVVPASNRDYDPNTKVWTITKNYYEEKIQPVFEHHSDVEINKTIRAKPKTAEEFFYSYSDPVSISKETKESLADKLIKLLECTPNDLADSIKLKRLYRAKALMYHPDRNNGDGSKMSELNSVWSAYNG